MYKVVLRVLVRRHRGRVGLTHGEKPYVVEQAAMRLAAATAIALTLPAMASKVPLPPPSAAAATQYLGDPRHTFLGSWLCSRLTPPLREGELQGHIALVTGGTGGIGLSASTRLAEAGAEVHVVRKGWAGRLATVTHRRQTHRREETEREARPRRP